MSSRPLFWAAILSVTIIFSLPAFAASPERPSGTTIFQIGTEDGSFLEFSGTGFPAVYICQARVDCTATSFPMALVVPDARGEWPGQEAVRVTIDFVLVQNRPDLVLRLDRGGVETLNVVVDAGRSYQVTSEMLGSNEGYTVGAYNLDLGSFARGSHSITFTVVDDGKGSGSFQWDALSLIAPSE